MPPLMADSTLFARDMGVRIIGGSCGTSPDHVAAMAEALAKTPVRPFDAAAMQQALGQPWADIPENPGDAGRRKSRLSHGNNAAMQILTPFALRRHASCSLGS